MSTVSDALTALRNVVLLQERLSALQKELDRVGGDIGGLSSHCASLDKRLVRIETMIEMTRARRSGAPQAGE